MENENVEQPNNEGMPVAATIPEFCIRDGSIMEEGVKYGFPAWICPSCTYWKIKL